MQGCRQEGAIVHLLWLELVKMQERCVKKKNLTLTFSMFTLELTNEVIDETVVEILTPK